MTDDVRLPLQTESPADGRLRELRRLLPEAFVEGKLDVEKLRLAVGDDALATGRERYGLSWAGKSEAVRTLLAPGTGTLLPRPDESVNFDTTGNLIIEGDNLEVLKLLQKSYHGKVKLIYIDPPYNTGNDFVYADDFRSPLDAYRRYTGELDDDGKATTSNRDTSGRFHSNWLNMMYPRLHLARNLLRDDGVIFVSIDDNEAHNLRLVMNEVFGEENFVATVCWQKKYAPANDTVDFSPTHDFLICYAARRRFSESGKAIATLSKADRTNEQNRPYKNPDNDARGDWRADNYVCNKTAEQRPNLYYPITHPRTGEEIWPSKAAVWRYSKERHERNVAEGRVWWGLGQEGRVPAYKRFLSEVGGVIASTWWTYSEAGHNDEAKKQIKDLFEGDSSTFDTPKPSRLIERILKLSTADEDEDLVLDFFAGSGTTAQAVLDLNEADGGNRKFILVQLPEKTDKPAYPTIAHITRERVRRVIGRITQARSEKASKQDLLAADHAATPDPGFRALRLSSSNFRTWDAEATTASAEALAQQLMLHADNLVPGRNEQDLLFELVLRAGLPLSSRMDTVDAGPQVAWRITDGDAIHLFCLATPVEQATLDALRALKPATVICLDAAFAGNDALKTNTVLQMKDAGIRFHTA